MNFRRNALIILILSLLVALTGCGKSYVVTTHLNEEMTTPTVVSVGQILDELPAEMPTGDRPSAEDIEKLKDFLRDEIGKRGDLNLTSTKGDDSAYEVRGTLIDYKKGSGAVRFFIGFGAGKAQLTIGLKLVNKDTDSVIFAGNFYGVVTGSSFVQTGADIYHQVARNFTKELEKQVKAKIKS